MRVSRKHNVYALCIESSLALLIGVATMGNTKALFVMLMDRVPRFEAYWSQFFAEFDWLLVLTSGLDTYIPRYGNFGAHDNNDDDTTDYLTPEHSLSTSLSYNGRANLFRCGGGNNPPSVTPHVVDSNQRGGWEANNRLSIVWAQFLEYDCKPFRMWGRE